MLKHLGSWPTLYSAPALLPGFANFDNNNDNSILFTAKGISSFIKAVKLGSERISCAPCRARRRVRYDDEDEENEEHGHNAEIAALEFYTQTAREEVLLVKAIVDEEEAEVLIFKGFSSCLSYGTSPDPSRSVLPARAVIKSIDRIRGPFDPSNIEYLEKGLTWEAFKTRL